MPASGDISFSDLAAKLPLTERQLRRLFKHAMTKNIFCEPRPNHVAHTALSIAPLKNRSLIPWINHGLGVVLPASSRLADAIEKFGDSEDITQVAVSMAWNLEPGKGIFDFFKGDGEGPNEGWRARQFAEAMAAMDGGGHDRRYTVEGFDWGSLGEATVVDVSIVKMSELIMSNHSSRWVDRAVTSLLQLPTSFLPFNSWYKTFQRLKPLMTRWLL